MSHTAAAGRADTDRTPAQLYCLVAGLMLSRGASDRVDATVR
jgi:hypothetical protein